MRECPRRVPRGGGDRGNVKLEGERQLEASAHAEALHEASTREATLNSALTLADAQLASAEVALETALAQLDAERQAVARTRADAELLRRTMRAIWRASCTHRASKPCAWRRSPRS